MLVGVPLLCFFMMLDIWGGIQGRLERQVQRGSLVKRICCTGMRSLDNGIRVTPWASSTRLQPQLCVGLRQEDQQGSQASRVVKMM